MRRPLNVANVARTLVAALGEARAHSRPPRPILRAAS
jgi:hypothetical protein